MERILSIRKSHKARRRFRVFCFLIIIIFINIIDLQLTINFKSSNSMIEQNQVSALFVYQDSNTLLIIYKYAILTFFICVFVILSHKKNIEVYSIIIVVLLSMLLLRWESYSYAIADWHNYQLPIN